MAVDGISGGSSNVQLVKTLLNRNNESQAVKKETLLLKKTQESREAVMDLVLESLGLGQQVDRKA